MIILETKKKETISVEPLGEKGPPPSPARCRQTPTGRGSSDAINKRSRRARREVRKGHGVTPWSTEDQGIIDLSLVYHRCIIDFPILLKMLALKWEEHGFTGDGPHENWPRNLANQISGQLAFDPKWLDSLNMLKYVEITSNHLKSPIITRFSWVFVCFWSPPRCPHFSFLIWSGSHTLQSFLAHLDSLWGFGVWC